MFAGSDSARKSLAPAPGAEGWANGGDVPVGAHVVPVWLRIACGGMKLEVDCVNPYH